MNKTYGKIDPKTGEILDKPTSNIDGSTITPLSIMQRLDDGTTFFYRNPFDKNDYPTKLKVTVKDDPKD